MPTFEFTSPDGKKFSVDGPAGSTKEQAFQVLQAQLSGGQVNPQVAGVPGMDPSALSGNRGADPQTAPSLVDSVLGAGETALSLATGATTGLAGLIGGGLAGVGKSVADGTFGTAKGANTVEKYAGEGMEKYTYAPRTEQGQQQAAAWGEALNSTLPVMPLTAEIAALGGGARAAVQGARDLAPGTATRIAASNAAQNAADAAISAAPKAKLRDVVRAPKSDMSGVGAAATAKEAIRAERFDRLGIKPTLGQLTRDKDQLGFEREIAKTKEGKAVDEHMAEQNAQVERVFSKLDDETGSQIANPYDKGEVIVKAASEKAAAKKAEATVAYADARAAGELREPIDVTNLTNFVKANKGKDKMAPIVSMIESEIEQNGKTVGGNLDKLTLTPTPKRTMMTLDAAEDLRQAINEFAEPGTPNMPMGIKAKKLLDIATEGKGGELYKVARKKWQEYSEEFVDRDIVNKLLRTKPGTKDRAVPFEKVFDHLIVNGDRDSVKHVFRVLEDFPDGADPALIEAGRQAAGELRGAFVNHIRNEMFSNGGANTAGSVVGSQKKILSIINRFDKKGVLDVVLGKEGAQTMRELRDAAVDLYTEPTGTSNHSNNANRIVAAIEKLEKRSKRIPIAEQVSGYAADRVRERVVTKRIEKALNPKQAVRQPNNF